MVWPASHIYHMVKDVSQKIVMTMVSWQCIKEIYT